MRIALNHTAQSLAVFLLSILSLVEFMLASLPSAPNSVKVTNSHKSSSNLKIRENRMGQLLPPPVDMSRCSQVDCSDHGSCLYCSFPPVCPSDMLSVNCSTSALCLKRLLLTKEATCKYCWQTEEYNHICEEVSDCHTSSANLVRTTCRVEDNVICRGSRTFYKNIRCRWTSGYSWLRAMTLSLTLGGFGFDRFYLGLWKSGAGKLFSFGGLGIWTLVDIALLAIGYLQPADGSLYI